MKLSACIEDWKLRQTFRIAGEAWDSSPTLAVQLEANGKVGRGEAQGVHYLGESPETMLAAVESVACQLENGCDRLELQKLLPAGGARNALDCALWDLECKLSGRSIWALTEITPHPVTTVFTIGLESTPEAMAAKAAAATDSPVLKIKLDADRPLDRLQAIRSARPDAQLVVDANQGWDFSLLKDVLSECQSLGLEMIEQPLPRGADEALEDFESPVLLAADESCQDREDLAAVARRYGMINIKLDKTGGLTEALELAHAARALGCKLMVGNMVGTSLGMAPAFVIAQLCDFVDIDGPLLLRFDHPHGLEYNAGEVTHIDPRLWG